MYQKEIGLHFGEELLKTLKKQHWTLFTAKSDFHIANEGHSAQRLGYLK